jgi:8-oxo-dGTP pyrophosphatase MutT (NUDIX family)
MPHLEKVIRDQCQAEFVVRFSKQSFSDFRFMSHHWKVLSSRYVLKRWWLNVRQDHVQLPSGAEMEEYHVMEYPNWTMMLALEAGERMVLVEQYRHGIGRMSLEFPSGMLEKNEKPEIGARREFREETGYEARTIETLGHVSEDPSRHNNYAHAFFSSDVTLQGVPTPDETEELKLVLLYPREVVEAVLSERMVHGLHIGAFYKAVAQGLISVKL